eukprot:6200773-Pleurochrysis_carterae.AAC.1
MEMTPELWRAPVESTFKLAYRARALPLVPSSLHGSGQRSGEGWREQVLKDCDVADVVLPARDRIAFASRDFLDLVTGSSGPILAQEERLHALQHLKWHGRHFDAHEACLLLCGLAA